MAPQQATGQMLLILGAILLGVGAFLYLGGSFGPLGRLPGDIRITNDRGGGFYFPIVTSIVVSIVLTILVNLYFFLRPR